MRNACQRVHTKDNQIKGDIIMKSSELIRILQDGIEEYGDKELYFHNSSDGESLDLVNVDYDWAEECFLQFNYSRVVIDNERVD